jgi:hypothetical protein
MARGRQAAKKNRNYPPLTLKDALKVPRAIADEAGGMKVSRLTLAELLDYSPTSSNVRDLVASSRFYGLTTGGINASEFALTDLGEKATGGDEVESVAALKQAVMNVPPYKAFFEQFAGRKMPSRTPLQEFLVKDAGVPESRAEECAQFIAADADAAGLVRRVKTSKYVDLEGVPVTAPEDEEAEEEGAQEDTEQEKQAPSGNGPPRRRSRSSLLLPRSPRRSSLPTARTARRWTS